MHRYDLLKKIGIFLDNKTGHLFYDKSFKPLQLNFELIFVRHGETYGNCGQTTAQGKIDENMVQADHKNKQQRVYQGNVNTEINQLTLLGQQQAIDAAKKLEQIILKTDWQPDIIFYSPLSRAYDTGIPFIQRNHFNDRYIAHHGIKEMSFGSWDNRRICDMVAENPCHLFYLNQNTLVKNAGINGNGIYQEAENFCDVLVRAYQVLLALENEYSGKRIIFFSHSMFGAACYILFGHGQKVEDGEYLAVDGKRSDGTDYTIPHATPVYISKNSKKL